VDHARRRGRGLQPNTEWKSLKVSSRSKTIVRALLLVLSYYIHVLGNIYFVLHGVLCPACRQYTLEELPPFRTITARHCDRVRLEKRS